MWKLFFEVCDLLCWLIPNRKIRLYLQKKQLFDWRYKYNALRKKFPELSFRHTKMIKGGWNIGFIVDKKFVFKIRKQFDAKTPIDKILREKRITDAFAGVAPVAIPEIEIVQADEFTFYKYNFIPGKNLNTFSLRTISKNRKKWGKQIAEFIYKIHNHDPKEIQDLKLGAGDGWNHNDICNNIIVNKKTMDIVGIIDWEYSGWGDLKTEFANAVGFSRKIQKADLLSVIKREYNKLSKK